MNESWVDTSYLSTWTFSVRALSRCYLGVSVMVVGGKFAGQSFYVTNCEYGF